MYVRSRAIVMGILEQVDGTRRVELRSSTTLGRSRQADLRIGDEAVSGLHAMLRWTGAGWELKDLGSHNGTTVGRHRVGAGEAVDLGQGDEIQLGGVSRWRLADAGPPGVVARSDGGDIVEGEHGMLLLPDDEGGSVAVYRSPQGHWVMENEAGPQPLHDGASVIAGGHEWALELPEVHIPTRTNADTGPLLVGASCFRFSKEAPASLVVTHGDRVVKLGRGPNVDLLFELARAGDWVDCDEVTATLNMTRGHLNVAIHRARRRLAELGFEDAVDVVQRRRGRVKLGCAKAIFG